MQYICEITQKIKLHTRPERYAYVERTGVFVKETHCYIFLDTCKILKSTIVQKTVDGIDLLY